MILLATVMRFIKKGFINHLVQNPIEDTTEHAIHEHELLYVYITFRLESYMQGLRYSLYIYI